jgi:hypothetical protein
MSAKTCPSCGAPRRVLVGKCPSCGARPSAEAVPEWASGFSPAQYAAFLDAVRKDVAGRGFQVREELPKLHATGPDGQAYEWGLWNLSQLCRGNPPGRWTSIVKDHFDSMVRSRSETSALEADEKDFAKMRPLLRVRLYGEESLEKAPGAKLVRRPLAPGIAAVLVFDLPSSVATVSSDKAGAWGMSVDELFRVGIENVRAEGPLESMIQDVEGIPITLLGGESFFTTTHACFLEDYLRPPSPHGALIGLPHRGALLVHPVREKKALRAVQPLIQITRGMYEEGPGSLSPEIYWWRAGSWTLIKTWIENGRLNIEPPDGFLKVIEKLS